MSFLTGYHDNVVQSLQATLSTDSALVSGSYSKPKSTLTPSVPVAPSPATVSASSSSSSSLEGSESSTAKALSVVTQWAEKVVSKAHTMKWTPVGYHPSADGSPDMTSPYYTITNPNAALEAILKDFTESVAPALSKLQHIISRADLSLESAATSVWNSHSDSQQYSEYTLTDSLPRGSKRSASVNSSGIDELTSCLRLVYRSALVSAQVTDQNQIGIEVAVPRNGLKSLTIYRLVEVSLY